MRKVCIVCDGHWDQLQGGAEYQLLLLSESLALRGYLVHYVYTDRGSRMRPSPVRMVPMNLPESLRRLAYPYHILLAPQLINVLRSIEPDVIINRVGSALTGIAAWYGRRNGIPVLWHIADITDVEPPALPRNRTLLFSWIDRKCLDYGIKYCTHIIAQARYQDELLAKNFARRATAVIPNFHPSPEGVPTKCARPLIVWVANIKPKKRPEVFIELASRLAPETAARFVMIGRPDGGRYQQSIERLLTRTPHVDYLGECSIDEVNQVLDNAWIFVNTSTVEGFPNTFVQAWLRSTAVVSLDFDPDGLLEQQKLGRRSGDFERLCQDVKELIDDAEARLHVTRSAAEYARQCHSIDGAVDRIAAIIEEACNDMHMAIASP